MGKMLRCIEDFYMETGERSFTAGKTYTFSGPPHHCWATDDQGEGHYMDPHYLSRFFVEAE